MSLCPFHPKKKLRVLVACEFSGVVREAFKAKGWDAWSCDLLPTEIPGKHYQGNVLDILNKGWDLMIAHPDCQYLTMTGNKWFKPEYKERFPDRLERRERAVAFFMALANAPIEKICIENPIGCMSSRWRKPNQIIQPHWFGEPARKATCLWLKILPPILSFKTADVRLQVLSSGKTMDWNYCNTPIKDRKKYRQRTFPKIAEAMAEQWT